MGSRDFRKKEKKKPKKELKDTKISSLVGASTSSPEVEVIRKRRKQAEEEE